MINPSKQDSFLKHDLRYSLIKGLIMDRCVLLTSTPECVVSPRRAITRAHPYPWLIPIITWCRPFLFVTTNILLIKSKLKLVSRAIAVGVAMSPRNLGGKYRCRSHPRPRTCTRQFFCGNQSMLIELHQSGAIAWRPWQHRRSCGVCKSWIYVAHCPFERKWRVLHMWYIPHVNRSVCILMGSHTWWRFSFCSSGSSLVCSMMTWRTARARISNVWSPM